MKLRILIFILALIAGVVAYLFVNRSNPVLYRSVDRASVQYSSFVILNPFRNREPERQAEAVLQTLKSRSCKQAISLSAMHTDRVNFMCDREQKYPPQSWRLMDYQQDGERVRLAYDIYRKYDNSATLAPPAWISVERFPGKWVAVSYSTAY